MTLHKSPKELFEYWRQVPFPASDLDDRLDDLREVLRSCDEWAIEDLSWDGKQVRRSDREELPLWLTRALQSVIDSRDILDVAASSDGRWHLDWYGGYAEVLLEIFETSLPAEL